MFLRAVDAYHEHTYFEDGNARPLFCVILLHKNKIWETEEPCTGEDFMMGGRAGARMNILPTRPDLLGKHLITIDIFQIVEVAGLSIQFGTMVNHLGCVEHS